MEVKNRLRDIRMREYAMEPKEFADMLGINIKTYYPWELGSATPSLKKCLCVAEKLNKTVNDIWYLEEVNNKKSIS